MAYGIDWSKVDEATDPRLASLKPKYEPKAEPEPEVEEEPPAPVRRTRAKRAPKADEEA
jgi:hypothetical protein